MGWIDGRWGEAMGREKGKKIVVGMQNTWKI